MARGFDQEKGVVVFKLAVKLIANEKSETTGVGCASHIIHNAFDSACDQLPINIESLAVNVFKHFRLHTLRVNDLEKFCDEAEVEYTKLVSHSGTRFLSLHPAVQKVFKIE